MGLVRQNQSRDLLNCSRNCATTYCYTILHNSRPTYNSDVAIRSGTWGLSSARYNGMLVCKTLQMRDAGLNFMRHWTGNHWSC